MKPSNPGDLIRSCIKDRDWTITRAAKELAMDRVTLHRTLSGEFGVRAPMALRLERVFGQTAEWWMLQQSTFDLWYARKYAAAAEQAARTPTPTTETV